MLNIVLIGAGNVGFHLGHILVEKNQKIVQIFSRKTKNAKQLAQSLNSSYTTQLKEIRPNADLYILAVSDAAIEWVAAALAQIPLSQKALVVHTSGATPSTVLKPYFKQYGIFYPLQTFSKSRVSNFDNIPICIHANRQPLRRKLEKLAQLLSPKVYLVDDQQRAILHVAAVFVNNFTNHLFQVGETILEKENLSFDILKPLIQETAEKIKQHPAKKMQTGPAIRGDQNTIDKHLDFLNKYPDFQELYQRLTTSIQQNK